MTRRETELSRLGGALMFGPLPECHMTCQSCDTRWGRVVSCWTEGLHPIFGFYNAPEAFFAQQRSGD